MQYIEVKNRLIKLGLTNLTFTDLHSAIEKLLNRAIPLTADANLYQYLLEENNIKAINYACQFKDVPAPFGTPEKKKGQTFYELITLILPTDEIPPYYISLYGEKEGRRVFKSLGV